MRCTYCRQKIHTPWGFIETRFNRLLKRDGTVVDFPQSFILCPHCHKRLPVDRET
jgi:hypothetical protein